MPDNQPQTPLREGSRWRHAKPSPDEVGEWFGGVPLDEGMSHEDYISGVVLIPASEKVKRTKADGRGKEEVYEDTFTPYVRVDTRIAYFHKLAEAKGMVAVIEHVEVPTIADGPARNDNMPPGFWWHITENDSGISRYLCCTQRVALYAGAAWEEPVFFRDGDEGPYRENPVRAVREGVATKQVPGYGDVNMLAKAETGAIGRALGMAGILVVGTGIATAEDMQELSAPQGSSPTLPDAGAGEEPPEALNARLTGLLERLIKYPDEWTIFNAWWDERSKEPGWTGVLEAPVEVRRGIAGRLESKLDGLPPLDEAS